MKVLIICLLERMTVYLGKRPEVGTLISMSGFTAGSIMADTVDFTLKLLSILVFSGTFFNSVLTAIGWFEKRKKRKNELGKPD